MPRFISLSTLGLICVAILPLSFAQTKDASAKDGSTKDSSTKEASIRETQSKESQAKDRRLDDALLDIRLLKRVVDEQARRITDLEKTVKALQAAVAGDADKPAENRARTAPKPFTGPKWQNPYAWGQINKGMSRVEVEDILGPPTTVDSVIDYQTLHYVGPVAGGERLEGTVKFTDDRVTDVILPEF